MVKKHPPKVGFQNALNFIQQISQQLLFFSLEGIVLCLNSFPPFPLLENRQLKPFPPPLGPSNLIFEEQFIKKKFFLLFLSFTFWETVINSLDLVFWEEKGKMEKKFSGLFALLKNCSTIFLTNVLKLSGFNMSRVNQQKNISAKPHGCSDFRCLQIFRESGFNRIWGKRRDPGGNRKFSPFESKIIRLGENRGFCCTKVFPFPRRRTNSQTEAKKNAALPERTNCHLPEN